MAPEPKKTTNAPGPQIAPAGEQKYSISAIAEGVLSPLQFEQLRATIIEAAVINGYLASGNRPASPGQVESLRRLIATVKEQVLG
jgi:hypothetical protein